METQSYTSTVHLSQEKWEKLVSAISAYLIYKLYSDSSPPTHILYVGTELKVVCVCMCVQ